MATDILGKVIDTRPQEVATAVARLAKDLLGNEVEVRWFGSWPKGTAWPGSDIDIALAAQTPIPLDQMSKLREAIDELPTLYTVDVVDMCSVGGTLKQEILHNGVKL